MSSVADSYHEEQASRRQLIEKKIDLRQSTLAEFAAVHDESVRRQKEIAAKQYSQAKQRNSQLLQDLRRSCTIPHRFESTHAPDPLRHAKSVYLEYVDRTLPIWKRQLAKQKLQELQVLEQEKEIASRRRHQQQQLAHEEAALHEALLKRQQELASTIALEELEKRQAHERINRISTHTEQEYYAALRHEVEASAALHQDHMRRPEQVHQKNVLPLPSQTANHRSIVSTAELDYNLEHASSHLDRSSVSTPASKTSSFRNHSVTTPTPSTKTIVSSSAAKHKTPERRVSIDPSVLSQYREPSPRKQGSSSSVTADASSIAPDVLPEAHSPPQIIHQGSVSSIDVPRTPSTESTLYVDPVIDLKRSPRKTPPIAVTSSTQRSNSESDMSVDITHYLESMPPYSFTAIIGNLALYITQQFTNKNLTIAFDAALRSVSTSTNNMRAVYALLEEAQGGVPVGEVSADTVATAILSAIDAKAPELMPNDVLNGVLTDQKLIKHYRKVGGGRYDIWIEIIHLLQIVTDSKVVDAPNITRIVACALCRRMEKSEMERAQRKIVKVLMLSVLPETESPRKVAQQNQPLSAPRSFALPSEPEQGMPLHKPEKKRHEYDNNERSVTMTSRLLAGGRLADLELDDFDDVDEIETPPKPVDMSAIPTDDGDDFDF